MSLPLDMIVILSHKSDCFYYIKRCLKHGRNGHWKAQAVPHSTACGKNTSSVACLQPWGKTIVQRKPEVVDMECNEICFRGAASDR